MDSRERVTDFSQELRAGPMPSNRSIRQIIEELQPQIQVLVNKQVELARAELAPVGRQAGIAAGLLAVAGLLLLLFLVFFSVFGMYLLNEVAGLSLWLSALIVAGVWLVLGVILAGVGVGRLRGLDPKPHRTISTLQQNIEWLRGQFRS